MSSPEVPGDGQQPVSRPESLPVRRQTDLERLLGESARVLISDRDRARVADVIGDAFAEGRLTHGEYDERLTATMSARTLTDLVPVVEGLPPVVAAAALAPLLPAPLDEDGTPVQSPEGWYRLGDVSNQSSAVAIFGGATRKGEWVVPAQMTAAAVFGGVELDLTKAVFSAPETTITANAIFGGVDITVPEGITVVVDGTGIFGGFEGRGQGQGDPGAPVLRVNGVAFFGGVDVKRKRAKGRQINGRRRPELPR